MVPSLKSPRFPTWSNEFKGLKVLRSPVDGAINSVIEYYKKAIAEGRQAQRTGWSHALGWRKNTSNGRERGELRIEDFLLAEPQPIRIAGPRNSFLNLTVTEQSFALTGLKQGQIIADALGFVSHRGV